MPISSEYNEDQLIAFKEREHREHIFDMLAIISAAIIFVVFVIAKWQS